MTDFQYKRAPITEAVVEFRSPKPIDVSKYPKAIKKLKKHYSDYTARPTQAYEFKIEQNSKPEARKIGSQLQHRFFSKDMRQQLRINDIALLFSQLAPYEGWELFNQRIIRDWEAWKSVVGFRPINRIGMRYINRIDLPKTGDIVRYEDYVTVYPTLPSLLDPSIFHSVNVRVTLDDIDSILNLNSAMVESPLPNHLAIVIDLDIIRVFQSPPSDEESYAFVNKARRKKNDIFESCITDKARELFNK